MLELEWSELVKLICNVTACCKMYVLSCNCYKMFCMFKSSLYLLERQKKKCFYHVVYKWMESNVCNFCIVTKCVCKMSFEMTQAVVMSARVVVTNCIYSMQFSCVMIQYETSPVCVCVRKSMFIVRYNCKK